MISFKKDEVENLRAAAQKQFAHHQTARETDACGERSLTAPTHGPSAFWAMSTAASGRGCVQPLSAHSYTEHARYGARDGPQGASCRRAHEQGLLLSLQAALIGHWPLAALH